jgi:hypothetical protein
MKVVLPLVDAENFHHGGSLPERQSALRIGV